MKTAAKCIAIALAYAGFFVVADSKTLARYVCVKCASIRSDVQYRPFDIWIATFRGVEKPTPCDHQWICERRGRTLRTGIPEKESLERPRAVDSRPVEFDPDPALRRWLEEFPLKPAR